MRRFSFASSRAELVMELSKNPRQFPACIDYLKRQGYTGQVLIDFHRGQPKFVAFPSIERVPLAPLPPKP